VTLQAIAEKGAVIIWPATDNAGHPPPEIAREFPDLAIEVPRAFTRQYQGRMPLMRIGWGMIRPRTPGTASEAAASPPVQPEPQPVPVSQTPPAVPPQTVPVPPRPPTQPQQAQSPTAEQKQSEPVLPEQPQLIAPEPAHPPPPRRRPRAPYQNMHPVQ
jgi:hypothetical protein